MQQKCKEFLQNAFKDYSQMQLHKRLALAFQESQELWESNSAERWPRTSAKEANIQ